MSTNMSILLKAEYEYEQQRVQGALGVLSTHPGHGVGLRPPVSVTNITVKVRVYMLTSEQCKE